MICATCNEDVAVCICPDRDKQLHDMAYDPAAVNLMFKWCRTCDRHYARCQCATPDFYVISAGKEIPVPAGGFRNMAGGRTVPDLKRR